MSDDQPVDVAIIGAGICGLMAATVLASRGLQVVLLDKGRSVGGRLATRRIGAGRADHGAQFFTVRTAIFGAWVERWQAEGLVYPWSTGWSDGSLASTAPDGHPRYAVHGGMNAVAKQLALHVTSAGAVIKTGVRVLQAAPLAKDAGWMLVAEDGSRTHARAAVLTAPAPQSLAMLTAGNEWPLANDDHAALAAIRYAACLCGLFTVRGAVLLPEPGALQQPDAEFAWIADNQRKGISPAEPVITVHAGPAWSEAHYGATDDFLLPQLESALHPWLAQDAVISHGEVKRWRYAAPLSVHRERMLRLQSNAPLYLGGDGFGEPRVEGAALSGLAIGHALAKEVL